MEERKRPAEGPGLRTNDIADAADIATVVYLENVLDSETRKSERKLEPLTNTPAVDIPRLTEWLKGNNNDYSNALLGYIDAWANEYATLKQQYQAVINDNATMKAAGQALELTLTAMNSKAEALQKTSEVAQETIDAQKKAIELLSNKKTGNETSQEEKKAQEEDCEKKLAKAKKTIKDLEKQVEELTEAKDALGRDKTSLKQELDRSRQTASDDKSRAEKELEAEKKKTASEKKKLEDKIAKLDQDLATSKSKESRETGRSDQKLTATEGKTANDECAKALKLIVDQMRDLNKALPPASREDLDGLELQWTRTIDGTVSMDGNYPPMAVYQLVLLMTSKASRVGGMFNSLGSATADLIAGLDDLFPDASHLEVKDLLAADRAILLSNSASGHLARISALKREIESHKKAIEQLANPINRLLRAQPPVSVGEPVAYLRAANAYLDSWGDAVGDAVNRFFGIQRRIGDIQKKAGELNPLSDEKLDLDRMLTWIGSNMTQVTVNKETTEALIADLSGVKGSLAGEIRSLFPVKDEKDTRQVTGSLVNTFTALAKAYNEIYSAAETTRNSMANVRRSLSDRQEVNIEIIRDPLQNIQAMKIDVEAFRGEVQGLVVWRQSLRDSYARWAVSMNKFARLRRTNEALDAKAPAGQDYTVTVQKSEDIDTNVSAFLASALATIDDCVKGKEATKAALAFINTNATKLMRDDNVTVNVSKIEGVKEGLGRFFEEMERIIDTRKAVTESLRRISAQMRNELIKARSIEAPNDNLDSLNQTFEKLPSVFEDLQQWIKEDAEAKDKVLVATSRLTDGAHEETDDEKTAFVARPTKFSEVESKILAVESLLSRARKRETTAKNTRDENEKEIDVAFGKLVASYNRMTTQMKEPLYPFQSFESKVFGAFTTAFVDVTARFELRDKEREKHIGLTKASLRKLFERLGEEYIKIPFPGEHGVVADGEALGDTDTFAAYIDNATSKVQDYAQRATRYVERSRTAFNRVKDSVMDLGSKMEMKQDLGVPYSIEAYENIASTIKRATDLVVQGHEKEKEVCNELDKVLSGIPSKLEYPSVPIPRIGKYGDIISASRQLNNVIELAKLDIKRASDANKNSVKILEKLPPPYTTTSDNTEPSSGLVLTMIERLEGLIKDKTQKEEKEAELTKNLTTEIYDVIREYPNGISPTFANPRGDVKLDTIKQQVVEVKSNLKLREDERKAEEKTRESGLVELYKAFDGLPDDYRRPISDSKLFTVDQAKQYVATLAAKITEHVKQDTKEQQEQSQELGKLYDSFFKLPREFQSNLADKKEFTVGQADEYVNRLVKLIDDHLKDDEKVYSEAAKITKRSIDDSESLLAFVRVASEYLKDPKKDKSSSSSKKKEKEDDEEKGPDVLGTAVVPLAASNLGTPRSSSGVANEELKGGKSSFMDIYSFVNAVSGRVSGTSSDTTMLKLPIAAGKGGAQIFIYALQVYVSNRKANLVEIKAQLKELLPREDESDEEDGDFDKIGQEFDRAKRLLAEDEKDQRLEVAEEEKKADAIGTKRKLKDSTREDRRLDPEVNETVRQVIATVRYIQRIDEMIRSGQFSAAFSSVVSSAVFAPMEELRVLLTQHYCRRPDKDAVTLEELVSTEILRQPISALCAEIINAVKASNAASFTSSDAHQRIVNQAQSSKNEFFLLYVRKAPYDWSMKAGRGKGSRSLTLKF